MEEPADTNYEEEVANTEALEQETVEGTTSGVEDVGDHGKIEITEAGTVSDKTESEVAKEKEEVLFTDNEAEHEFREEEGDVLDETEELHGAEHPAKVEPLEFVKKKKPEPKVRRVDMDVHFPDESKTSMDEKLMEKKAAEAEAEGVAQDMEDSEELIDPNKDYSVVDPSFLDEFDSSEEEQVSATKKSETRKIAEALERVEEEEDDFQQEIYVQPPDREPSDRVYDQICDLETPVSSDESFKVPRFKYIPRRKSYPTQGFKPEENEWLPQAQSVQSVDIPSTALLNLMENIAPALKKTLLEIATYQPSNAVYYMTHSLLHKSKTSEEIGLEPDPHLIQLIVDGHKRKKRLQPIPILKKTDKIFVEPYAESHVSTPHKEIKPDTPIKDDDDDDDDEDQSDLQKFQRKYRKAKKEIMIEEKAKRLNLDPKTFLPGPCLGPTSLPLSPDPPSKNVKSSPSKV